MQLLLIIMMTAVIAAAGYAALHVVRLTRRPSADALRTVGRYGYDSAAMAASPVVLVPPKAPNLALEKRMAKIARRLSPADYEQRLKLRLLQAGMYETRPSRFLMLRLCSMVLVAGLAFSRAASTSNHLLAIVEIVAGPYIGWMLPETPLSSWISRRHHHIETGRAPLYALLSITLHARPG